MSKHAEAHNNYCNNKRSLKQDARPLFDVTKGRDSTSLNRRQSFSKIATSKIRKPR